LCTGGDLTVVVVVSFTLFLYNFFFNVFNPAIGSNLCGMREGKRDGQQWNANSKDVEV
jgi:hypothetical protein